MPAGCPLNIARLMTNYLLFERNNREAMTDYAPPLVLNYHHDILFFTLRPLFSNLFSKNARSKIHLPSLAPLSFDSKQDSTNRARFLKLFPLIEFAPGYWNEQVEEFGDDRAEECIDRLGRVRRSLKIHDISGEGRGRNGFGGSKRTSWKVGLKKKASKVVVPEFSRPMIKIRMQFDRIGLKLKYRREDEKIGGYLDGSILEEQRSFPGATAQLAC